VNQLDFEKKGIPTVTIATTEFINLAKQTALGYGVADMAFVVVPHPIGSINREDVRKKADDSFPEILKMVTEWKPATNPPPLRPLYPAETFKFKGDIMDIQEMFFKKGWSAGLPIVPPTAERVKEMLRGTSHSPDELICQAPPRMGAITVELVAVYAVMAGCKPEYMPVLLAVLDAMREKKFDWREAAVTTGSIGPMIMINGPIIKELDIAYNQAAASWGHHPNLSIGYAIGLLWYVAGGAKPPIWDKSTFGSPTDLVVWVFAENEDANPWEPYHVEMGYKKSENVVTVRNVYPTIDIPDHNSKTAEQHLKWWVNAISPMIGKPYCLPTEECFLVLNPEWSKKLAEEGWTKDKIRKYVWENCRRPFSAWPPGACYPKKEFELLTTNTQIPLTLKPEQLRIVVSGGAGKHNQYFIGAKGKTVTKPIDPWR
jgi:hypothetical protein